MKSLSRWLIRRSKCNVGKWSIRPSPFNKPGTLYWRHRSPLNLTPVYGASGETNAWNGRRAGREAWSASCMQVWRIWWIRQKRRRCGTSLPQRSGPDYATSAINKIHCSWLNSSFIMLSVRLTLQTSVQIFTANQLMIQLERNGNCTAGPLCTLVHQELAES